MPGRSSTDRGLSLRAAPFLATGTGETTRLLTSSQRNELLGLSTKVSVPAGRILYHQEAISGALFFCVAGMVKTFHELRSGTRRITAFLFPDDVFGLAKSGRYLNTAQAVLPSICYRIPLHELTTVLQRDAGLQYQFLCKVTHELRELQHRLILMTRREASGRLAMFLTMLHKNVADQARPEMIPIPMSRADIAGFLGLSEEAVSRGCAQLSRERIVSFPGRHLARILDAGKLEQLADDV